MNSQREKTLTVSQLTPSYAEITSSHSLEKYREIANELVIY